MLPALSLQAGLYLIATPIGNLSDITLRALATLKLADAIYCEDRRVSQKLCQFYDIQAPLYNYHDHNGAQVRPEIIAKIKQGQKIALISDAGTPLIADPGYKLVRALIDEGLYVTSLPGASAILTALSLSGLPSDQFLFAGFIPVKAQARKAFLQAFLDIEASLIFYETAPRLLKTLASLIEIYPDAQIAIGRELTKYYEEILRGTPQALYDLLQAREKLRGEICLIVNHQKNTKKIDKKFEAQIIAKIDVALANGDSVKNILQMFNLPRKKYYPLILARKGLD